MNTTQLLFSKLSSHEVFRFGFHYFGWQIGEIARPLLWGVVGNLEGDESVLIRNLQFKIIPMIDIIGIRFSTFSGTIRYKPNFRGPILTVT